MHNEIGNPSYILYALKSLRNGIKIKNPGNLKRCIFYVDYNCKFSYSKEYLDIVKKAMKLIGIDVNLQIFKINDNAKKDAKYYYRWRIQT